MSAIFVIIDPSGVRALPLARVKRAQTRKRGPVGGSIIFGIIFLLFFSTTYFSPGRGCLRVMKFCTEF